MFAGRPIDISRFFYVTYVIKFYHLNCINFKFSIIIVFVVALCTANSCFGQIQLSNASFEDKPKDATTPIGWNSCGDYSTPDILPGYWEVTHKPVNGNTFLGLITREDGTNEWIGQQISGTLEKNVCYSFTVTLARSDSYANYNRPVILRIWGGQSLCERKQLLAQTLAIEHTDWKEYEFVFLPKMDYEFIIIEAVHTKESFYPYKGNLLIDNCSTIDKCDRAAVDSQLYIHN